MGFFLRRSLRLGPVRFNLSKSGVGVSAGVKGLRVGVDARGKGYVAGGRYGLYFRERLSLPQSDRADGAAPPDDAAAGGALTPGTMLVLIVLVGLAVVAVIYATAPAERAQAPTKRDEPVQYSREGGQQRPASAASVPAPPLSSSTSEAKAPQTPPNDVPPDKPGCFTRWYGKNSVTICDSPGP
jgi:Protein of unknown function (DUF4236)